MDWAFTVIGGVSFVAHLLFVMYLRNVDWPRKPDIEDIPDRFVQMAAKAKPPEPPKQQTTQDKTDDKTPDKQLAATQRGEESGQEETFAQKRRRASTRNGARGWPSRCATPAS